MYNVYLMWLDYVEYMFNIFVKLLFNGYVQQQKDFKTCMLYLYRQMKLKRGHLLQSLAFIKFTCTYLTSGHLCTLV